ncbi:MAG: site-specific integrase [Oscillospiraceae bacterium]|nr:site-specific integrase [Oscillospiraceae bacterium]
MPRKAAKKYGSGGNYYRKRIKNAEGRYEDVYGRTQAELAEKVTLRLNQIAAAGAVSPEDLFFFEYAAGWYSRREPHLSPGMRKMMKHEINDVICPVIGGKRIREITSDDLAAVMATRAHLSRSAQSKTVQVIRQVFDAALEAGVIEKLPTRRLRAEGKAAAPKKALTESQAADLLDAVRGLPVEPCVMLGLYTGMRREEICGLLWDCVELDGPAPHITVRRACRWPKNTAGEITAVLKTDAASRVIPIPKQLVQYLHELRDKLPGDPMQQRLRCVYGSDTGKPLTLTAFRRRWEAIYHRSTTSGRSLGEKVKNHRYSVTLDFYPTPHILRHTYITRLILGGVDLKRVQYLAGHADPKVTLQIYTDLMGHAPEDLIADVDRIFGNASAGESSPIPAAGETAEPVGDPDR